PSCHVLGMFPPPVQVAIAVPAAAGGPQHRPYPSVAVYPIEGAMPMPVGRPSMGPWGGSGTKGLHREPGDQATKGPGDQANGMRILLRGRHGSLAPGFPGPLVAWFLGP